MLLWAIFHFLPIVEVLQARYFLPAHARVAIDYLECFFQVFSYIAVISLCKLNFWKESATKTPYDSAEFGQSEYAPMQPGHAEYTYSGQPVHNGIPAPASGTGHVVR